MITITGTITEIRRDSGSEIAVRIITDGETHTQGESEVTLFMDESHSKELYIGKCIIALSQEYTSMRDVIMQKRDKFIKNSGGIGEGTYEAGICHAYDDIIKMLEECQAQNNQS